MATSPSGSSSGPAAADRRVVPDTRARDRLIAALAGIAILAFVAFAVAYFSRQADSTGGVAGTIVARNFVPQKETQITFGQGGLRSKEIAGEYSFQVRVDQDNKRIYKVIVDPAVYQSHQAGDAFYFIRPSQ